MARFDFQSPGAAYTEEMTKLLAERKAEQRQQMLDQLTQQQEARAERESVAMQQYRNEQLGLQRGADEREQVSFLEQGLDPMDTDLSDNLTPEQIQMLQRYGRVREMAPEPIPSVSTEASIVDPSGGPAIPVDSVQGPEAPQGPRNPTFRYVGDKKFQEQQRQRKETGNMIAGLMSRGDPESIQLGQTMTMIANANGGVLPDNMMGELFGSMLPGTKAYGYDPEGGEFVEGPEMPRGSHFFQITRPPRGPSERPQRVGKTEDGYIIYARPDGTEFTGTYKEGPDPNAGPLGIAVGNIQRHTDNAYALGQEPSPGNAAAFRLSAAGVIQNARVTTNVKSIANAFVTDPRVGAAMLARMGTGDKSVLTPQELTQLSVLLQQLGVTYFKDALIATAPKQISQTTPQSNDKRLEDALAVRSQTGIQ